MISLKDHWDSIFSETEDTELGWYEKDTSLMFSLLNEIPELEKATVFLPGAGTSNLIEDLIPHVDRLIVNDISDVALNRARQRIKEGTEKIVWLHHDISQELEEFPPEIDVWIDRAVLHFLNDEKDIKGYFKNLTSVLKKGGHAVFAEFSLTGAPKCAGLPVHRYSTEELSQKLGPDYKLQNHFHHTHINPSGEPRPYIFTLFKKDR